MNLEFIQLANYFPYELNIIGNDGNIRVLKYNDLNRVSEQGNVFGIKPILRPLSDLDSTIIDEDGFEIIPSIVFGLIKDDDGDWCNEYYAEYCESPKAKVLITHCNTWLFKYHFDIFGLIENGLAISIHDVGQADA